ncbi:hypothetical protein HEK131_22830 [Streptomyces seoulensis]|nr:hypothetical protein HEK131_22830 [Streptomyces seoulensis]
MEMISASTMTHQGTGGLYSGEWRDLDDSVAGSEDMHAASRRVRECVRTDAPPSIPALVIND